MNVARTNACATTLKDGRVLVVGNWYNSADYAEIYDPLANTFTLTGACLKARAWPVIIPTDKAVQLFAVELVFMEIG
jgi:hypothetical protein